MQIWLLNIIHIEKRQWLNTFPKTSGVGLQLYFFPQKLPLQIEGPINWSKMLTTEQIFTEGVITWGGKLVSFLTHTLLQTNSWPYLDRWWHTWNKPFWMLSEIWGSGRSVLMYHELILMLEPAGSSETKLRFTRIQCQISQEWAVFYFECRLCQYSTSVTNWL
jgi:hypothetical protein